MEPKRESETTMNGKRFLVGMALLFGVASWNCGSGSNHPMPDAGIPDAGMPDGGMPTSTQIADFAKQLVLTETADNNEPETTEDKDLVSNQDLSSFDSDGTTFPPSFFP
jgi:hypothetical protein